MKIQLSPFRILGFGLIGIGGLLSVSGANADDFLQVTFTNSSAAWDYVQLWHSTGGFNSVHPPLPPYPALEIYSLKSKTAYDLDARSLSDDSLYHIILTGSSNSTTNFTTPAGVTFGWYYGPGYQGQDACLLESLDIQGAGS